MVKFSAALAVLMLRLQFRLQFRLQCCDQLAVLSRLNRENQAASAYFNSAVYWLTDSSVEANRMDEFSDSEARQIFVSFDSDRSMNINLDNGDGSHFCWCFFNLCNITSC
ncbi:hypothetical protein TUM4445_33210 [Shewanella sp. MBTL60-112-B2]|nr:hypothetical protein TUM4444_41170 [Shewanella sp. MBTL60-112-B1]GIU38678.1 hypothetical protein TUM4445_33210 [Shewanella sp. MBTL60-112-B2]